LVRELVETSNQLCDVKLEAGEATSDDAGSEPLSPARRAKDHPGLASPVIR
jgi:hypothetical protein